MMSKKIGSSKKRRKNRRILSVTALVMLLAIGLVVLIALQDVISEPAAQGHNEMLSVNFYFRDADHLWGHETRQLEAADNAGIIEAVLQGLKEGPRTAAFLPSVPEDVYIQEAQLISGGQANTLRVIFSRSFGELAPIERVFATSSLVWTLTDLDFVDQLSFYIGDAPMLDGDGNYFGLRDRGNTSLEEPAGPMDVHTAIVALYFPDEQFSRLVREERTIAVNVLEDIERFILDALIEGPRASGLVAAIEPTMAYHRVERTGDMVIVDFAQGFYDSMAAGGSAGEHMMVYSLVNTLTARPEIRRVQIFIDGLSIQPDEDGGLHMDISRPIERNEDLITGS